MLEIFRNLEQTAALFSPTLLIASGLAAVLIGLFLWLGGLGMKNLVAAIVGALAGGIAGLLIFARSIPPTLALATAATIIALLWQRVVFMALTASLSAAPALIILASPYIHNPAQTITPVQNRSSEPTLNISAPGSIQVLKVFAYVCFARIKQACSHLPVHNWLIIAALIATAGVLAFFFRRVSSAFCCAVLGTVLIFAGLIALLLYKGSQPITHIGKNTSFYLAVFSVMLIFGTMVQLLFCPRTRKQPKKEKKQGKCENNSHQTGYKWRGR